MTDQTDSDYEPPELTVHGSVEELTEGFGGSPTDAESGSSV